MFGSGYSIDYQYLRADEITNPSARKTVIRFRVNGATYYFDKGLRVSSPSEVPGPPIHGNALDRFVTDKHSVKAFLRERGFIVPKGSTFGPDDERSAESFFTTFQPTRSAGACVKPNDGCYGSLVFVGVREVVDFRRAFWAVGKSHSRVLIEEAVPGQVYRFLYLSGRVAAITLWRRVNVEGNGTDSLRNLIELKNAERRLHPDYFRYPLQLESEERDFLIQEGFTPDHVPEVGQAVFLGSLPNEDEAIDATDEVDSSYIELVERAVGCLPGLFLCGVDVVIQNARLPATADNHHFLELNAPARTIHHHYPWRGRPRDVAGAIVECLAGSTDSIAAPRPLQEG